VSAIRRKPTFIDLVEEVFRDIYERERFHQLVQARYNHEAVEGSTALDDFLAASMLRERALEMGIIEVGKAQLNDIKKALNHVMRRYNMSRKQRRAS
jgi:hypothetical protein